MCGPIRYSRLRAVMRLLALATMFALLPGPLLLVNRIYPRWRFALLRCFFRTVVYICGLRLRVSGPAPDPGALLVANHVSYLDIVVLGATVNASFVSKAEVAKWPAIGFLSSAAGTVFIDRRARYAGEHVAALSARLSRGESLVVFPEGASSDGSGVLPFKSTLFGVVCAAHDAATVVQPLTLCYGSRCHDQPMTPQYRDTYAWYGGDDDADFVPHAWRMLCGPGSQVEVRFHPPMLACAETDRKFLAAECQAAVAAGIRAASDEHLQFRVEALG
ncbi:MAG: 1-acyl-sn-glycerol-3-phosphate acyltransferase [Gammaproteobacteria bacterium]|nr:1-acyl-sn-glycerol-3-phosphate acyltransferase [Gammaproteobacteria bacterium]